MGQPQPAATHPDCLYLQNDFQGPCKLATINVVILSVTYYKSRHGRSCPLLCTTLHGSHVFLAAGQILQASLAAQHGRQRGKDFEGDWPCLLLPSVPCHCSLSRGEKREGWAKAPLSTMRDLPGRMLGRGGQVKSIILGWQASERCGHRGWAENWPGILSCYIPCFFLSPISSSLSEDAV